MGNKPFQDTSIGHREKKKELHCTFNRFPRKKNRKKKLRGGRKSGEMKSTKRTIKIKNGRLFLLLSSRRKKRDVLLLRPPKKGGECAVADKMGGKKEEEGWEDELCREKRWKLFPLFTYP